MCCIQEDRLSLLDFKAGLDDPANFLASWVGQACCEWKGVQCSNRTGHVIGLSLYKSFGGEIGHSLLELKQLRHLRINNFKGIKIPTFIGSLKKLTVLSISDPWRSQLIPYQLRNLSSLRILRLSQKNIDSSLYMDSGRWLSNLSSLQCLHLKGVDLSKADGWLESLNRLPSLSKLYLSGVELGESFPLHFSHVNFTSLRFFRLDRIGMNSVPSWLFEISGLEKLGLSSNRLQNLIPDSIGNLTSLRVLDLSRNGHMREIPATLGKLCMLSDLRLSGNYYDADMFNELGETFTTGCIKDSLKSLHWSSSNLTGRFPDWLWGFKNLNLLNLQNNSFYGAPLPASDQQLPPLQQLYLGMNKLNGTISKTLGQMSELFKLDLNNNNLEGVLSEAHFSNLTKLHTLLLGFNSLLFDVGSNWVPPLGLTDIDFFHCKVGPAFPSWIRELVNLSSIDISDTSIADTIPGWFWNFSSGISFVNLSNNEIKGTLPNSLRHLINLDIIDLSNNLLEGPLPQFPSNLVALKLSNNSLSGTVQPNIDILMPHMSDFSISTNHINGSIPFPYVI